MFKAFGKKSVESVFDSKNLFSGKHNQKIKELRNLILYIAVLFTLPVAGQHLRKDTISISEVVITGKSRLTQFTAFKKSSVDSSALVEHNLNNIADLLSENTHLHIKSYGLGGIATSSFRGTGASHTQVAWNGININNPMPGQSDLSLIPAGIAENISLYSGGGSMIVNGGAIGGLIDLETGPEWRKRTSLTINSGTGSYGRLSGMAHLKTGNARFQSVTKAYFNSAKNNFRYVNNVLTSEPFTDTRKNSQVRMEGYLQEFYLYGKRSSVSAKVWYNSSSRNIPVPMISQQPVPGEKQNDRSLRSLVSYDLKQGKSDFNLTAAYIADRLNYSNPLTSTDSRNLSRSVTIKAGVNSVIGQKIHIHTELKNELYIIYSNNYDGKGNRNTTSLTASADRPFGKRLITTMLLRGILNDSKLTAPDFATGIEYRLLKNSEIFLKGNFSANSKLPNLNDLYWMPGGNPDLKSEYGYIYEAILEAGNKTRLPFSLSGDLTVYRSRIMDMIQWHPGEYSYWTADNIKDVNITGLEFSSLFSHKTGKFSLRLNALYSFTIATQTGNAENSLNNKQLIYIPVHQASATLRLAYGSFYSSVLADYTGKRYLSLDNSSSLPGYVLNDIILGMKLNLISVRGDMNFAVSNIFNTNYQAIAWHPMPGRSYSVNLLLEIIKQ